MTTKSGLFVGILIASGCLSKACGDGEISTSPRGFEAAPTPDQPNFDEPTPDQSDLAGRALEPENTQGPTWETIYERCTTDVYPAGYRPPLFVRPTMQNTGANCPDKASGCPPDAVLTERTTNITSPGVYENFHSEGTLRIQASNVTIRNFEHSCTADSTPGVQVENYVENTVIEYGTIKKGTFPCEWAITALGANTRIRHVHIDQYGSDGVQSSNVPGPVMVERSLFTRAGDNGGYGSSAHADTWQYYNARPNRYACWLGSRVAPAFCPNFYKISNATQSFDTNGTGKWYIYNNWLDGATNVMLGGSDKAVRNNKFGNLTGGGRYWLTGPARTVDYGGNTFECNGQPVPDGQALSPQLTCPWGYDNDPVTGWDGVTVATSAGPLDGQGNGFACSGTADSQPIDPTEFCTSDGSGCIVTPAP